MENPASPLPDAAVGTSSEACDCVEAQTDTRYKKAANFFNDFPASYPLEVEPISESLVSANLGVDLYRLDLPDKNELYHLILMV